MSDILKMLVTAVSALGGWETVKYLLNRKFNRKVEEANAFDVQRKAIMEDYKRVQKEVDDLKAKVDDLYKKIHSLENERLDLIKENNELKLALKEAEKHLCLQPDDRCLQRLNPNDECRLRKVLRGEYGKDHPGAIISEEDMKRKPEDCTKNNKK